MATNATIAWASNRASGLGSAVAGSLLSKVLAGFAGYVALCSALRFRRVKQHLNHFKYHTRESLSKMTVDEARAILQELLYTDFPFFYETSLQLALFRVLETARHFFRDYLTTVCRHMLSTTLPMCYTSVTLANMIKQQSGMF
jgi:hypothetical protein